MNSKDKEKRCERIVFCADKDDEDRSRLFSKVSKLLQILLDSDYVAVVRYDEPEMGIIVIEFEHDENADAWGVCNPEWVTEDELFYIENMNDKNSDEIEDTKIYE